MKFSARTLMPAGMLALGAVYVPGVAYLNITAADALPLPELRDAAGRWQAMLVAVALFALTGIALLSAGHVRVATVLAVLALLLVLVTEMAGVLRARNVERMRVSLKNARQIAESLATRDAPLPQSLEGTPHAASKDGWGNAFRYRSSRGSALIVAANGDRAFAPHVQLGENFAVADAGHDIALTVSRGNWTCSVCPRLPAVDPCLVRSLFGCITYWD